MEMAPASLSRMNVCGDCGALVGEVQGRRPWPSTQRGPCPRHAEPDDEPRWEGYLLKGAQAREPVEVHRFLEKMKAIFATSRLVREWGREVVRRNLDALGEPRTEAVPAPRYLEGIRESVEADDRFREMCAFLQRRANEDRPAR